MANGWARDGAVTEQIEASISDALQHIQQQIPRGESKTHCLDCNEKIPESRRRALPGVRLCVPCQQDVDCAPKPATGINRRGSKDSQLR